VVIKRNDNSGIYYFIVQRWGDRVKQKRINDQYPVLKSNEVLIVRYGHGRAGAEEGVKDKVARVSSDHKNLLNLFSGFEGKNNQLMLELRKNCKNSYLLCSKGCLPTHKVKNEILSKI
jgi:hypothetical protein